MPSTQPPSLPSLGKHVVNPWSDRCQQWSKSIPQSRVPLGIPPTMCMCNCNAQACIVHLTGHSGQHPSCLCPFLSRRGFQDSWAVIVQLCNASLARASSCCSSTRLNFHGRNALMIFLIKVYIIFKLQQGLGSLTLQIGLIRNANQHRQCVKSQKSCVMRDVPEMDLDLH